MVRHLRDGGRCRRIAARLPRVFRRPCLSAPAADLIVPFSNEYTYHKSTLSNGVRAVTGPMTGVKSGTLIMSYTVGSRHEPAPVAGVSHFLEHMLFKGTEKRPDPKQISEEIEGVGGVLNAATSREGTSYWFKAPSSHF